MNFFKDLIENGAYDTTNHIHTECMKFVFVTLRQREFVTRKIRNSNCNRLCLDLCTVSS